MKPINIHLAGGMIVALLTAATSPAAEIWSESFETDGEGTRYTSATEFKDVSGTGYFMRSNNSQTSGQPIPNGLFAASQDRRYGLNTGSGAGPYNGMDGTWTWVGESVDGDGSGPYPIPASVTFNTLATTGYTNLQFSGLFGATLADAGDFMRVSYSTNGGPFVTALYFAPPTTGNGQLIYLDTDNDSLGNVSAANLLDKPLKSFSVSIPDASTVQIRVEVRADAANDEFAFDYFRLTGDSLIPEPSTAAFLFFGLSILGWRIKTK